MKDFSVTEIFSSVKCQFVRRCTHSQSIISRLADDFIGRYSSKQKPHPQFFKEDVSLTQNQLTIYADQCVQVMRKFQFLHIGADIVAGITNSTFRIIDFLAKQLYHHMRDQPLEQFKQVTEPLCTACNRLRENERVRSLRQQLNIEHQVWDEQKLMRQMVIRKGQKYDEQQLLYESLQNLQALNEQQIRKKLNKMELDHDKRKKQILVAVQELTRANQRVTTYSRALERSGKEYSGKFNVKDYVFQLGRHFYHNISSLDVKIRHLRQALSPITHQEAQTDYPVVLQSTHNQIVANLMAENSRIKNILHQTTQYLTIEQNKNIEFEQTNALLQQKLQESDVARQHQKIEQKIKYTQISNNLSVTQFKIGVLQSMVRKLKANKGKQPELVDGHSIKQQSITSELISQSKISSNKDTSKQMEQYEQSRFNHAPKTLSISKDRKQSFLLNPRAFLRFSMGNKSINQQFTQRLLQIMPSAREIVAHICEQSKSKLNIYNVYSDFYLPINPKKKSEKFSKDIQINKQDIPLASLDTKYENDKQKSSEFQPVKQRKKLSKIDVGRYEFRNSKHRQSDQFQNTQNIQEIIKKKPSQRKITLIDLKNTFDERLKLNSKKILSNHKSTIGLPSFKLTNDKQIKKSFGDRFNIQKKRKFKKARNLSQENSYQQYQTYESLRKSIETVEHRERSPFGQKQKHILAPQHIQSDIKAFHKGPSLHKTECGRIILSLQQINYSTYFYSILANIHLRNQSMYENVRKFMVSLIPGLYDDENNVKDSLNSLILGHRRCSPGSICTHLEVFLERVKSLA